MHGFESAPFPFGGPVLGSLLSPCCAGEEARVPSNLLSMEAWGLTRPARTPMPLGAHSASQDWPKQEFLVAAAGGGLSPLLPVAWVLPCLGASLLPCLPQTLLASTMLAQGPWCGGPHTGPEALSWGGRSLLQNPGSSCTQELAVVLGPAVTPSLSGPVWGPACSAHPQRASGGPFLGAFPLAMGPFSLAAQRHLWLNVRLQNRFFPVSCFWHQN